MKKIFLLISMAFLVFSPAIFAQGAAPTNLLVSNITTTEADLSWVDNGCASSVLVKYKVSGSSAWLTASNTATSPYTLTGLSMGTDYDWRVKCIGCTGGSCWSTTSQFITSAPEIDTAFISQPILCYGGFASDEMQINITQSSPASTYSCVIGYYFNNTSYFISFYSSSQTNGNQLNFNGFNPNTDYFVRIVDSAAYFNANNFGNGQSTVGVLDEAGPINFYEPAQLTVTNTQINSNLCYSDCVAQEEIIISGGTQPYSYILDTAQIVILGPQSHVINTSGNTFVPSVLSINIGDTVTWNNTGGSHNINGTQATFVGNPEGFSNGAAVPAPWFYQWVFTVAGTYDYQCDPHVGVGMTGIIIVNSTPSSFSTDTFMNLCEGAYDLVVSDLNGCATVPPTTSFTIDTISPILMQITPTLFNLNGYNVSCFGASDGEITASTTGGTGQYTYSIDTINFQTSPVFSALTAGTYTVSVKDENGCIETETLVLNEPSALSATASVTRFVDCYGGTGEITINYDPTQPGTPSYQYSIDNANFQSSNSFDFLPGNITYDVMIKDDNGCEFTVPVYLSEPTELTIDSVISSDITCNGLNDGSASIVSLSGGTPFTIGQPYTYLWDDSLGQTTQTAIGLSAGTYTCTITDAAGCFMTSSSVAILDPTQIISSNSTTSVSCFGGSNAEIIINSSGGTPFTIGQPYTYLWDDPLAQTTQVASGLSAGTYTCNISDSNGCSFTTPIITIIQSSQISANLSRTNITCYGLIDGTATVNPNGGTPFSIGQSYIYLWDDPLAQTTPTAIGLLPGTYTCNITDSLSCDMVYSITITEPPLISSSLVQTNINCHGLVDGTATVSPFGGRPFTIGEPYTYLWDDSFGQTTQTAIGLSAGQYACTIYDSTGCFLIVDSIIIIEPALLQIDSIHYINESCFGANDGEILSMDILGGVSPFEYSVNGSTHYSNMAYFNGYDAGTYTVEVFDLNNCAAGSYIIITEPDELIVDIITSGWVFNNNSGLYSYQIKCNGDNSGYAHLTINGGTAPYIKNLYNAITGNLLTTTNLSSFSSLSAGEYVFEVIDAKGCIYSETILFSQPDPISHTFIATHVTCSEWSNGSLIDIVSGGVGNSSSYVYLWNTGDSTYSINGIPLGVYSITVTDENNCISTASHIINDNNALAVTTSYDDISCYDYCDGEISAIATGGAPNLDVNGNPTYTYQWNDILSQTTQNAVGLCADNNTNTAEYSCIITDGQGCRDTVYRTLDQPDSLYVSAIITSDYNLQDITCYGASDGKLKATTIGGTSPYDYTWSTGFTQNNANISNISNLSVGIYAVIAEDSNGCMDTTEIILSQPTELTLTISQTNINCFNIYDGTIVADADGGTPFPGIPAMYNYSFSSGFNEQISISTDIEVAPGIYTVIATDNNGCSVSSESIFISQPTDILTIDLDSLDETCNESNGEVISNVSGGTQPYTYAWSNGGNTSLINELSPGMYTIIITDFNDCLVYDTIRVNGSEEIFLPGNITSFDTTICLGSNFTINIEEKLGFSYRWEFNDKILLNKSINNLTNDYADIVVTPIDYINIYELIITDPSCNSSYQVTATINVNFIDPLLVSEPEIEYGNFPIVLSGEDLELSSENNTCVEYTWQWRNDTVSNNNGSITISGVKKTDWYYLYVEDGEGCLGFDSIYVVVGVKPYEAITPNNDGFNDTWTPLDIQSYENAVIQVFNRWGGLVFESEGGENYQAWDGTNSGKELVTGTYYYIIDLNTGDEPQTGPITIIR